MSIISRRIAPRICAHRVANPLRELRETRCHEVEAEHVRACVELFGVDKLGQPSVNVERIVLALIQKSVRVFTSTSHDSPETIGALNMEGAGRSLLDSESPSRHV
jgi:hypothetical protein